jgi:hypothetical protein
VNATRWVALTIVVVVAVGVLLVSARQAADSWREAAKMTLSILPFVAVLATMVSYLSGVLVTGSWTKVPW